MKNIWEIFWRFLSLGCLSFGGPAAHIGYFQTTFVQQLKWLDDDAYARLISLSQFLPGPGSSQIGFAIGLRRAGLAGGCAAFAGFTLPSFLLMYLLASTLLVDHQNGVFNGIISGLKLLAVVVVADATLTMFSAFCKEKRAIGLAVITAALLLFMPSLWTQMIALIGAAIVGMLFGRPVSIPQADQKALSILPLVIFLLLFIGLPLLAFSSSNIALFADFFQAGSLVFGGGHVVLPLLQQTIGTAITTDQFLVGYAGAQAVPGPMFTFASYLGAELMPSTPLLGAVIATSGIFLPGFLLVMSFQGAWESLAAKPKVAGATWGLNAAVVGLLMSALYQPVFASAVHSPGDMASVLLGLFLLRAIKVPVIALVMAFIVGDLVMD